MKFTTTCVVACVVWGCGSAAVPPAKMTDAKSDIKAAEAVGAVNQPRAALHLKLARDQVQQAEARLQDGDEEEASLLLDRARVDAQIALVMAREAQMRLEAQQALKEVERLSRP